MEHKEQSEKRIGRDFNYNLAAASSLIKVQVAKIGFYKEEKEFLLDLIKKINTVEQRLREWSIGGELETYHLLREQGIENKKKLQQADLINESIENHKNMLIFTYIQANEIKKLLNDFKEAQGDYQYVKHSIRWDSGSSLFFKDLDKCIEAVLQLIQKEGEIEEEKTAEKDKKYEIHLSKEKLELLSGKDAAYKLAIKFGASYYPLIQSLNPLIGGKEQKEEGNFIHRGMCAGFVIAWRDTITEEGYLKHPVGDKKVSNY